MIDDTAVLDSSQKFTGEFEKSENKIIVPVLEEKVNITKKVIETARVNVSKTINEVTESFETPLAEEQIFVERIPKNEIVVTMPAASRYEGDVMIIPVLKEVAVIEKRIMLVEEIHISKIKSQKTDIQEIVVRKEEINITRTKL